MRISDGKSENNKLLSYADTTLVVIPRDYVEHDCREEGEVKITAGETLTLPVRMRQWGGLTRGKDPTGGGGFRIIILQIICEKFGGMENSLYICGNINNILCLCGIMEEGLSNIYLRNGYQINIQYLQRKELNQIFRMVSSRF